MDETKEYFGLAASACLADVVLSVSLLHLPFYISVQTHFCALDLDSICHIVSDLILRKTQVL